MSGEGFGGGPGVRGGPRVRFHSPRSVGDCRRRRLTGILTCLRTRSGFCRRVFTRRRVSVGRVGAVRSLRRVPIAAGASLRLRGSSFVYMSGRRVVSCIAASNALKSPIAFILASRSLSHLSCGRCLSFAAAKYAGRSVLRLVAAVSHHFVTNLTCCVKTHRLNVKIVHMNGNVPRLR